ncbi:MAG: hypothetical protein H6620_10515 [Halobacteriovoraceae bacterium]|nr:hypothetical protein [Halobacteriovoraceae bacterium]
MIRGLEHFKDYFRDYSENFILVGGVASYLLLDEAGVPKKRATKDLDIVLMMKPTSDFLNAIKSYISSGGYEIEKGDNGQSRFYRFKKPKDNEFPLMIELFATAENDLDIYGDQHIIPIAKEEGVESLSAILLDHEYYSLIKNNGVKKDGIYILNDLALIPFKAKAYLEIKQRGEDSRSWKKHRGDIINLTVAFLTSETREELKGKVREHFIEFIEQLESELTSDIIEGACKQKVQAQDILNVLRSTFL